MEIGGIIKLRQSQILPSFQDSFFIGKQKKKKKKWIEETPRKKQVLPYQVSNMEKSGCSDS